jgi:predicted porin
VLFDGSFFLLRPKGFPKNAQGLSALTWGGVTNCLEAGGGLGADCNGYPNNGVRYDSPTWGGFSVSGGYAEDDTVDVAVRYAADWNNFKVSAAYGFTETTDEGCSTRGPGCFSLTVLGGGGAPFQGARRDATVNQVGASVLHVPTGLFVYGMYQKEQNNGTSLSFTLPGFGSVNDMNDTDVWYVKAGIKRTWTPLGATVLFGEGGQYKNQFTGALGDLCAGGLNPSVNGGVCLNNNNVFMNGSTVDRWGAGVVQEIDAAAMHVWFNWQHLELDAGFAGNGTALSNPSGNFHSVKQNFDDLDMFMAGGVIFF